jgi:glycolate oxidase iron-sulfur subunit
VLPYPGRFRLALLGAQLARPFRALLPDRRLRAMVGMAPRRLPPRSALHDPQVHMALGPRRMRVALMTGCAQQVLNTDITAATIRLLTRLGAEVVVPDQGCCGALTHHMGREDQARTLARRNIVALTKEVRTGGLDAVVITTSGCGTSVKDYGHLFKGLADEADAIRIGGLTRDITEIIATLGLPKGTGTARVAYHAACSLQHGQQVKGPPKDLLKQAGFIVVEPADAHLCCGSAGTYNLLQPEISAQLQDRKVKTLMARTPEIIATGNIGCMMQIGQKAGVPVVHTVELLDWATGGPQPPAMGIPTPGHLP